MPTCLWSRQIEVLEANLDFLSARILTVARSRQLTLVEKTELKLTYITEGGGVIPGAAGSKA